MLKNFEKRFDEMNQKMRDRQEKLEDTILSFQKHLSQAMVGRGEDQVDMVLDLLGTCAQVESNYGQTSESVGCLPVAQDSCTLQHQSQEIGADKKCIVDFIRPDKSRPFCGHMSWQTVFRIYMSCSFRQLKVMTDILGSHPSETSDEHDICGICLQSFLCPICSKCQICFKCNCTEDEILLLETVYGCE